MNDREDSVLLFSYFKGHGDGLHLAISTDGLSWEALNADEPLIIPQVGPERLMRDPYLLLGKDGLFHLVWTSGWRGKSIGYAYSEDLRKWPEQRLLNVMEHEAQTRNCWAPEIFFDDRVAQYVVYWASTVPGRFPETDHTGDDGLNHRMYFVTTKDFRTLSTTKLFFDPGFNVIDASLVKDDNRYVMFMKDERLNPCQKNIRVAISDELFGAYSGAGGPITGPYWAEGPTAIKLSGQWIVYFDKYKLNQMGAVRSADLQQWEDISDKVHFPPGAQHGSVTRIPFRRLKCLI